MHERPGRAAMSALPERDLEARGPRHQPLLWSLWVPAVLLAAVLLGLATASAWAPYTPAGLGVLLVLYGLLASTLHLVGVTATRSWPPLGVPAAITVASVVLWHLREQTGPPGMRPLPFAGLSVALGVGYFCVLLSSRRAGTTRAVAASALLSAAMFTSVLALAFLGSNTLRWQLLRQNKLLGTPAYLAWGEPIALHREEGSPLQLIESVEPELDGALDESARKRRDIVLILIDTLRKDSLATYGGRSDLMPNLNRFAEQSLVFADVLANATWTRPSVASLFTGLPQEEHGAADRDDRLSERHVTMAEALGRMGYETAAFVTNFAAVGRDAGFAQGFHHFAELAGNGQAYLRAGEVNAAVLDWLEARAPARRAKPIFLYIHYLDPHEPHLSGGADSAASYDGARQAYRAELRYLDRELGSLLSILPRWLSRETAYLVTADHGEEFGEHGEGGHGHSLYSEVADLPALLSVAGSSGRSHARLEARDFFELILRLAESPETDPMEWAASRSRRIRYASVHSRSPAAWHRPYQRYVWIRGLEQDGYLLIWSAYGPTYELYDLTVDRGERHNLAAKEPERADRMIRGMQRLLPRWAPRVAVHHSEASAALLRTLGYAR